MVSLNIYYNFMNYGLALRSCALRKTIERLGYKPVLMGYCLDVLENNKPLNLQSY